MPSYYRKVKRTNLKMAELSANSHSKKAKIYSPVKAKNLQQIKNPFGDL